jgi:tol-pal system protein YbgF
MKSRNKIVYRVVLPLILLLFAFGLRRFFFSGFILGDDGMEFAMNLHIIASGPFFQDQLHQRFSVWLFNSLFFKLFGVSETTFFLPTWIMSASLSVIGYYILLAWQYRPFHAFLAGLFVASAPFEIIIGSVHANDLILSWLLALGMLCFVLFEKRPVVQGTSVAFFCWLAFYVKLWAVYVFPALALYYFIQVRKTGIWRGLTAFCLTSFFLHGITSIFWKINVGFFFPFLIYHPGTYPVEPRELVPLLLQYPKMIFQGSEFGTTLFGLIPYALIVFLLIKIVFSFFLRELKVPIRFDRPDIYLLIYYSSYFLLMNFFPHSLKVDRYYSTPRIFRYLAPISFPMTLHLAKLILDVLVIDFQDIKVGVIIGIIRRYATIPIYVFLILVNIFQTYAATEPGRAYRKALLSIIKDVKDQSPPKLLAEFALEYFLKQVYLKEQSDKIVTILGPNKAEEYEQWLEKNQQDLPVGTMMITGLGSYVYYGAHWDGFRLRRFANSLDPHWKLVKEYNMLKFLPLPEPARLWRLSGKITVKRIGPTSEELYKEAVGYYDKGNFAKARPIFLRLLQRYPYSLYADSADFLYGISYLRENRCQEAIEVFQQVIGSYPNSFLVPEAYYHIGSCQERLNQIDPAKVTYRFLTANYSGSNSAKLAKQRLYDLTGPSFMFKEAMAHYDRKELTKARDGFLRIVENYPNASMADTANYFYAITYWRDNQYQKTIEAFKQLIRYYPNSSLVPEAYYHIGLSYRALNQPEQAKTAYRLIIQKFSTTKWANVAQERLKELENP